MISITIGEENRIMAVLNIRKIPDVVHRQLRLRAARAGRSMEAEAREILTRTCMADENTQPVSALQDWVDDLYGPNKPKRVVESLIAERRKESTAE